MIEPDEIDKKVRRLQFLLKAKFRIETEDLRTGMKKAGRRLPKRLHRRAELVIAAQTHAANPKLARVADEQAIERAFSRIEAYLEAIDVQDRRIGAVLGMLGVLAFNLILAFLLFMAVLHWRDFI